METIMVNIWGGQKPAILTTWSEIKKRGFKTRDRMFGTLNDRRQALFFNGSCIMGEKPNGGEDVWFVTTETLDQISD